MQDHQAKEGEQRALRDGATCPVCEQPVGEGHTAQVSAALLKFMMVPSLLSMQRAAEGLTAQALACLPPLHQ